MHIGQQPPEGTANADSIGPSFCSVSVHMQSPGQRQGEFRAFDIYSMDSQLIHQSDDFLELGGFQRQQRSIRQAVVFALFLQGLQYQHNV
ncbi:hypothetical protein D3C75_955840 [compost metagenome]